jgi:hypothetical protein
VEPWDVELSFVEFQLTEGLFVELYLRSKWICRPGRAPIAVSPKKQRCTRSPGGSLQAGVEGIECGGFACGDILEFRGP